uniref:Uncharacterized protein n=1 Tax=Rhizochromulina marina TaxID=1034831 RepID=A0A7S2RPQ0_9STRA
MSLLYRQQGHAAKAWPVVVDALIQPMAERSFSNNFYIFECTLPLEAAFVIRDLAQDGALARGTASPLFLFGWHLLRRARRACNSDSQGFIIATADQVDQTELNYQDLAAGTDAALTIEPLQAGDVCLNEDGEVSDDIRTMLARWGLDFCVPSAGSPGGGIR